MNQPIDLRAILFCQPREQLPSSYFALRPVQNLINAIVINSVDTIYSSLMSQPNATFTYTYFPLISRCNVSVIHNIVINYYIYLPPSKKTGLVVIQNNFVRRIFTVWRNRGASKLMIEGRSIENYSIAIVSRNDFKVRIAKAVESWALAEVLPHKLKNNSVFNKRIADMAVGYPPHIDSAAKHPSTLRLFGNIVLPDHGVGGVAGVFNGLTSEDDLLVKHYRPGQSHKRPEGGNANHPKGPHGGRLLGREVTILVILCGGGWWIGYRSFHRAGQSRNIWQTLGWSIIVAGGFGITAYCGILLMVGSV